MDKTKKFNDEAKKEKYIAYYSKKGEEIHGSSVGSVPDGKGGRKEIIFSCSGTGTFEYNYDDKIPVWEGDKSEFEWVRQHQKGSWEKDYPPENEYPSLERPRKR